MLSQHKRISEDFIDLIAKIMKKKNKMDSIANIKGFK